MIQAADFRIGNLINLHGKPIEVRQSLLYDMASNPECIVFEDFQPIPLTEEWLLKLGAKKNGMLLWISLTNLKAELHFEIYGSEIVTSIISPNCELILDPIKSVHQLQNLYHSLTGEELIPKS